MMEQKESQKIPPAKLEGQYTRNLLEIAPMQDEFPKNHISRIAIGFDIATIVAAVATGFFASRTIEDSDFIIALLVSCFIFVILSFFENLLIENWIRRVCIAVVSAAAILAFFYSIPIRFLVFSCAAMILFFLLGDVMSRRKLSNTIRFRYIAVAKPKIRHMVTGILLAGVLLYAPIWQKNGALISESQFSYIYEAIAKGSAFYEGPDLHQTIQEFTRNTAKRQLEKEEGFSLLSADQKETVVRVAAEKVLHDAGQTFGISITEDLPLANVFYAYITRQINTLKDRLGDSFLFIWIAGAFLVARSVGVFAVWVAIIAGYLMYELLFALDIVKLRGESVTKEIPEFTR